MGSDQCLKDVKNTDSISVQADCVKSCLHTEFVVASFTSFPQLNKIGYIEFFVHIAHRLSVMSFLMGIHHRLFSASIEDRIQNPLHNNPVFYDRATCKWSTHLNCPTLSLHFLYGYIRIRKLNLRSSCKIPVNLF